MSRAWPVPELLIALAALCAAVGCREVSHAFAANEREFGTGAAPEPRPVASAEPDELQRMRERLRARDLGDEPEQREARFRWNLAKRLRCTDVECTDKHLRAIEALGDVSTLLLDVVASGPTDVERHEAILLIGLLGYEPAAPAVARLLTAESAHLRSGACRSLRWLTNPNVTTDLVAALSAARETRERRCLLRALAGRPGRPAALALGNVALGPQADEALVAVAALKRRKDPDVVAVLGQAVESAPTWPVRRASLEALHAMDVGLAYRVVRRATTSRDSQVKALARRLLAERRRSR